MVTRNRISFHASSKTLSGEPGGVVQVTIAADSGGITGAAGTEPTPMIDTGLVRARGRYKFKGEVNCAQLKPALHKSIASYDWPAW
jgi:hypothetical protein